MGTVERAVDVPAETALHRSGDRSARHKHRDWVAGEQVSNRYPSNVAPPGEGVFERAHENQARVAPAA